MVNSQTLQGNWNEVKGRIRNKWSQMTGDELGAFDGNVDRLVGMIQRKTGEARTAIENFLEQVTADGGTAISGAMETARSAANHAAAQVQAGTRHAMESAQRGYEDAQQMVQRRPMESVAVCFASGLLAGVILGMLMKSPR